ncbi:hypothetical protein, partial [Phaeobacter sp. 11ANDIMAR09]|uniref:hypothetical protein n=1 Tax=Phaeobacter sp. 11ANDIMAR09 TaxID=1225647 RepID=UPI0006D6D424
MLQINTGKLFQRGVGRKNELRGVLYSNGWLIGDRDIETKAGTLKAAGSGPKDRALVYELIENIEEGEKSPGFLISHTVTPYLNEFSVVASFSFDVVVTPDHDLLSKLVSGGEQHSGRFTPDKFVKRFFDNQANILDPDIKELIQFVDELLRLERKHYLGSMRAIKTYIAALHCIPYDPARAYTLMVSAVETLAQEFDDYRSTWIDVDDRKRKAIDDALSDIENDGAEKIRHAILESEHLSLSRRYRAFVSSKIEADFFRVKGSKNGRSIARWEVSPALKQAYGIRSQYIHSAKPLPDQLAVPHEHWEVATVERRPALT